MIFTTLKFLVFFAIVFLAYYILPKKMQWGVLLIASMYFYLCASVKYVVFLLSATLVTYLGAIIIDKIETKKDTYLEKNRENLSKENIKLYKTKIQKQKKLVITITILITLAMLIVMKYTDYI